MSIEKLRPSFTFTEDRLRELQAIAPEAFADGKINWDSLREALGEHLEEEAEEHFGLTWPGKRDSRRLAALPSKGTLMPLSGEGVNEESTNNIFIEGENLEVLKLLQKSYAGEIGIIYIDPPYNTGSDFVYDDNYIEPLKTYLERTGQMNEAGITLTTNSKASGRFHSKWLSLIYPRLLLAKNLLRDDGVIFVSIGEDEYHNLKVLLCDIFGEENFAGTIIWQKSKKGDAKLIAQTHEYILVAVKNKEKAIESGIWRKPKDGADEVLNFYDKLCVDKKNNHEQISIEMRKWYNSLEKTDSKKNHQHYCWSDERGLYFAADFAGPDDGRKSRPRYDIIHPVTGKPVKKPSTGWRWEESRTKEALLANPTLIHFGKDETTIPCRKVYLKDVSSEPYASVLYRDGRSATLQVENLVGKGVMEFPKNTDVLSELIQIIPDKSLIVLDFFAGSCSTGHAVLDLNCADGGNRKFIMVQIPERTPKDSVARAKGYETIAEIGKKRLREAIASMRRNKPQTKQDLGFTCYELRHSNFKEWESISSSEVKQIQIQFEDVIAPLISGWKERDLFVEILLIQGFPLNSIITRSPAFHENQIFEITHEFCAHRLFVCLDKKISDVTVSSIAIHSEDILVCLDSALSDEAKLRLSDRCNIKVI